ncbi:MAG: Maf family protein [Burkholderiales bacterium]
MLASTSPYRHELFRRLQLPFEAAAPSVDEAASPNEPAASTAARLSRLKARAVASQFPFSLIIGSDQVADCDGLRIEKPGDHQRAFTQLRSMSGQSVTFSTAVTLFNASSGGIQTQVVTTIVRFRQLLEADIERYLKQEPAYDCVGSAKVESLGISLLEAVEGDDPTALIGLPLITLCRMLRAEGVSIP